jgi:hypothetical protein
MGVLHGRDLLSPKYPTAIIKDVSKRLHFVPIKHTIGDYFMTKLDNKWYIFKIDSEVCEYRETLTKSFKVYMYDTNHFRPLKSEVTEIEHALKKNHLPKINSTMADVFKLLGSREKNTDEFTGHNIAEIIKKINNYDKSKLAKIIPKDQNLFKNQMEIILNYLDNLGIEKIVTPVKSISNFIQDDLRGVNPGFLGTVGDQLESLDFENKKVNNTPIGSKKAWVKIIAVALLITVIGLVLYMANNSGAFDEIMGLTSSFDAAGDFFKVQNQGPPPTDVLTQYPTPESAKAAIDAGKVNLNDFPVEMRPLINSVKVEAKQ